MQLSTIHPVWADAKYVTRHFGITASPLYGLRKSGAIRSVSLTPEGKTYGKRLYFIESIEAHIIECELREQSKVKGDAVA